jgi:YVTN family beta-propeller protein
VVGIARSAGAGLAVAAVGVALAGCGGSHVPAPPALPPALRAPIIPSSRIWVSPGRPGHVTARVHLNGGPTSVAFAQGALWVTHDDGHVSRIDPGTNRIVRTARTGRFPVSMAFTRGAVWIANSQDDTVSRLDPRSGRRTATIQVGDQPTGLAVAAGSLWVANGLDDTVTRIDVRTARVDTVIRVGPPPSGIRTVAAAGGAVWVTGRSVLSRIDPATNAVVARIRVSSPAGPAVTNDAIWVANEDDDTVTRLDPRTGRRVATVAVGANPTFVATDGRFVWVLNNADDTVTQIDEFTDRPLGKIHVGPRSYRLAAGGGAVWVQSYVGRAVYRIEPRRGS